MMVKNGSLPQSALSLNLNFKLNAVLVVAFATLLLGLVTVARTTISELLSELSRGAVTLEASTLQQHFSDVEAGVLNAAKLLSSAPGLVEGIEAGSTTGVRTAILIQGESLDLDDIAVINAAGERLLTIAAEGTVIDSDAKDRLFSLALIGADTTNLIPDRDGYLLAGFVPVKNDAGAVIGAIAGG